MKGKFIVERAFKPATSAFMPTSGFRVRVSLL